jgi:glycosyltransferase involved in cell wall biosynthesis
MTTISAIVHTRNEEQNIGNALGSLAGWVDEMIVVDMESTDRTIEIAKSYGAIVRSVPNIGYVEPAREAAVVSATGDWIVNLDADEMIPVGLAKALRRAAESDEGDAYLLPRMNYIFGRAVLHTGWAPDQDRQLRFFRRDALVFSPNIHARPRPKSGMRVRALAYRDSGAIVHFNYIDTSHFLSKLDKYTEIEAREGARAGKRVSVWALMWASTRMFIGRFVIRLGFRDGWLGLYLTILMVAYRAMEIARIPEVEAETGGHGIRAQYQQMAQRLLSEYGPAAFPSRDPAEERRRS